MDPCTLTTTGHGAVSDATIRWPGSGTLTLWSCSRQPDGSHEHQPVSEPQGQAHPAGRFGRGERADPAGFVAKAKNHEGHQVRTSRDILVVILGTTG